MSHNPYVFIPANDECPHCNSNELVYGLHQWEGETAWIEITCKSCGCEFNEVFQSIGYEIRWRPKD